MRLPDEVFATLHAERARYGAIPSDMELGRLLNAAAWAHPNIHVIGDEDEDGNRIELNTGPFGLSHKVGGITVPMPGGGTICHDVLMLADGTAWDVLVAAGEDATPTQGDSFMITDPARGWIAPVDPGEPVPPPPIPVPPVPPDLFDIFERLNVIEAAVAALQAEPVPEPCNPSQWEAAGRIAWWPVTLPLRHKR